MATAPMKSQPLHNFSLPFLKWGTHHQNRTRDQPATDTEEPDNDNNNNNNNDDSARHHRVVGSRSSRVQRLSFTSSTIKLENDAAERERKQKSVSEKDYSEKALKEPAVLEKNETEEEEGEVVGKPWNLRPRKVQEALFNAEVLENHNSSVNMKAPKSTRLREMVESRGNNGEKKEKNKFWLTLSREEVEEDIFVMTGSRPARRPRKRPKNVQKQLDNVFPGLWLVGLTVDSYRAADAPMKYLTGFPTKLGGRVASMYLVCKPCQMQDLLLEALLASLYWKSFTLLNSASSRATPDEKLMEMIKRQLAENYQLIYVLAPSSFGDLFLLVV